eukprot:m.24317 g.24317  ORF g.24317 m.24317 type:complete len:987 (-) comp7596_c0_seq1:197-3157(-)
MAGRPPPPGAPPPRRPSTSAPPMSSAGNDVPQPAPRRGSIPTPTTPRTPSRSPSKEPVYVEDEDLFDSMKSKDGGSSGPPPIPKPYPFSAPPPPNQPPVVQEDYATVSMEEIYNEVLYDGQGNPKLWEMADREYYTRGMTSDRRDHILQELIGTECGYVKILKCICEKYKPLFTEHKNLFSSGDEEAVFINIDKLLAIHEQLLVGLEAAMESAHGRRVAPVFDKVASDLRAYGLFCAKLPEATQRIKKLMTDSKILKVLDSAKQKTEFRFGLAELLAVPFQRILKYPLLLNDLVKHTPDNHPDTSNLKKTLNSFKDMATFVNTTKAQTEAKEELFKKMKGISEEIFNTLGALVLGPDTILYKYVKLKNIPDDQNKLKSMSKCEERQSFLLQSGILLCKGSKNTFTCKNILRLSSDDVFHQLTPSEASEKLGKLSSSQRDRFTAGWIIRTRGGAEEHIFGSEAVLQRAWAAKLSMYINNTQTTTLKRRQTMAEKRASEVFGGPRWEIPRDSVTLKTNLTTKREEKIGAWGHIWEGQLQNTVHVAVRCIVPGNLSHEVFSKEADVLKSLRHKNLVTVFCVCVDEDDKGPWIVSEFVKLQTLSEFLSHQTPGPRSAQLDELIQIAKGVANGMATLARFRVVHGRLSPKCVFVGSGGHECKIFNFGFPNLSVQGKDAYAAPEAIASMEYTHMSDVWSYGVVLHEIVTFGRHPFAYAGPSSADMINVIRANTPVKVPSGCPASLGQMILNCCNYNPTERPKFDRLIMTLEKAWSVPKLDIYETEENRIKALMEILPDEDACRSKLQETGAVESAVHVIMEGLRDAHIKGVKADPVKTVAPSEPTPTQPRPSARKPSVSAPKPAPKPAPAPSTSPRKAPRLPPKLSDGPPDHGDRSNWLHGVMSRQEAGVLVQEYGEVGSFLMRKSESGDFSITFWSATMIQHFKIRIEGAEFIIGTRRFPSLEDIVVHYTKEPLAEDTKLQRALSEKDCSN